MWLRVLLRMGVGGWVLFCEGRRACAVMFVGVVVELRVRIRVGRECTAALVLWSLTWFCSFCAAFSGIVCRACRSNDMEKWRERVLMAVLRV